jgi:hypothetical protein
MVVELHNVTVAASIVLHHFGGKSFHPAPVITTSSLVMYDNLVESGISDAANSYIKLLRLNLTVLWSCRVLNFLVPTLNSHMFSQPAMFGHLFVDIYIYLGSRR